MCCFSVLTRVLTHPRRMVLNNSKTKFENQLHQSISHLTAKFSQHEPYWILMMFLLHKHATQMIVHDRIKSTNCAPGIASALTVTSVPRLPPPTLRSRPRRLRSMKKSSSHQLLSSFQTAKGPIPKSGKPNRAATSSVEEMNYMVVRCILILL